MTNAINTLADLIRDNGPIRTARVSSAQSGTQYSYWGATRYELRLTADGIPTNQSLERARSDRRSVRLAQWDCAELCERENRIQLQAIGRLTEADAQAVLYAFIIMPADCDDHPATAGTQLMYV